VSGTGPDQRDIDWLDDHRPPRPVGATSSEPSRSVPSDAEEIANPRRRVDLSPLRVYWRYAVVAAVALLVGGAITAVAFPRHSAATPAASTSSPIGRETSSPLGRETSSPLGPATPGPAQAASGAPAPAGTVGAITVGNLNQPLLAGLPPTWNLFARGPGVVVRFELAGGRTTTTIVPELQSSGPVAFVAGADRAIVRPLDSVPGFAVTDSGAIAPLTGALADGGDAAAGPDSKHLWIQNLSGTQSSMELVDLAGNSDGPTVMIPVQGGSPTSDDAGGLVFTSIDGMYAARPGSTERVTTGPLVAVGATRWLAEECDDHLVCTLTVIDRSTGTRRTLTPSAATQFQLFGGQISPDGRTAALVGIDSSGTGAVHLLDLNTGQDTATQVSIDQDEADDEATFAWSPDSRWLFSIDGGGVSVINRSTAQRQVLLPGLDQLTQLAFRAG
jgi:hypothetical protein